MSGFRVALPRAVGRRPLARDETHVPALRLSPGPPSPDVQSVAPLSSSRLGVSFLVVRTFALPTKDRFYLRATRELESRGYAFQASGDGPTPFSEFAAGNAGVQIEPGKPKPPRIIDDESYFRTEPDPEWVMVTVWEEDRRPEWAIIAEREMKWVGRGFR